MIANMGPKKAVKVLIKVNIEFWLKTESQNVEINNPDKIINRAGVFKFDMLGNKLIKMFCEGTQFAIKLVEREEIIINISEIIVKKLLSILPIISLGFVRI